MLQGILGNCWLEKLANSRGQNKNINDPLALFVSKKGQVQGPISGAIFGAQKLGPLFIFIQGGPNFGAPKMAPLLGTHCRMFLLLTNAPTGDRELNIIQSIAQPPAECWSGKLANHHGQKLKHKHAIFTLLSQNEKQTASGPHLRGPSRCPELPALRDSL